MLLFLSGLEIKLETFVHAKVVDHRQVLFLLFECVKLQMILVGLIKEHKITTFIVKFGSLFDK